MSNDERPQDVSSGGPFDEADTTETRVPYEESGRAAGPERPHDPELTYEPVRTYEPVASAEPPPPTRWQRVSEPARRHPVGLAVGTALAGLVIGLLGGVALNAHPMMSLQVGTAPGLSAVDRQDPGATPPGPAGDRHGPKEHGRQGPPPPPDGGPGGPGGQRGPGGPGSDAPPPGGPRGPVAEGQAPGGAQRPDAPAPADGSGPTVPTPPGGSGTPRPANPGGDAPQQPPLPAERGGSGQSSGT